MSHYAFIRRVGPVLTVNDLSTVVTDLPWQIGRARGENLRIIARHTRLSR